MAAATIRLSMYPKSVLLRKEHRIRVALARTDASLLSGTGRRNTQVDDIREAQRRSIWICLRRPMSREAPAIRYFSRLSHAVNDNLGLKGT
jgi:hypothetical protein